MLTERGGYEQAVVRRWTNAPRLVRQDNGLRLRAAELGVGPATSFVVFDEIAQQPRAYDPALAVSPRNAASLALEGEIQLRSARGSIRAEQAFGIYRRALAAVSLERAAEETGKIGRASCRAGGVSTCSTRWAADRGKNRNNER